MSTPVPGGENAAAELTPSERIEQDPEFQDLKSRFGKFIFPMTALFMAWYFAYVFVAVFAPDFMKTTVSGNINVGLVWGLLQFVSTFAITMYYRSWMNKSFDPAAERFRRHLEEDAL